MAEKLNSKANRTISKALLAFFIFVAIILGSRIFLPDPAAVAARYAWTDFCFFLSKTAIPVLICSFATAFTNPDKI